MPPTALNDALMMPIQRPNWLPLQIENAANSWTTPTIRMIQPHMLRSSMMNRSSSMKNDAESIAAMPQIVFRIPTIRTMIPAKSSQPSPLTVSFMWLLFCRPGRAPAWAYGPLGSMAAQ